MVRIASINGHRYQKAIQGECNSDHRGHRDNSFSVLSDDVILASFSDTVQQNRGLCLSRSHIWLLMQCDQIMACQIVLSIAGINPVVSFGLMKSQSEIRTDLA
jgi:hypothetical protein